MTDPRTEILLGDDVELTLHVVKTADLASTVYVARDSVCCEQSRLPVAAHVAFAADTVTRALIGRTVAAVERDLIMETLKHCFGNRTHAANILGISIRTLRNRLNEYATDGVPIPPPGGGDMRQVHRDFTRPFGAEGAVERGARFFFTGESAIRGATNPGPDGKISRPPTRSLAAQKRSR